MKKIKTRVHKQPVYAAILLSLFLLQAAASQDQRRQRGISGSWLIQQIIPSYSWTSFPQRTNFAFEWEAAPVLFSFNMNKLNPKWHYFKVTQPERFTGSIELVSSVQLYTSKVGTSYWGFSGQILAHLPLIEYGEYMGLNFGAARYWFAGTSSNFIVGGFSTLFGFLHCNVKYCPSDEIWMYSIDFRFF
ncbi:MAG: hypothetical protein JXA06_01635 [Bacteroidetes bacterium]|nr:hypothetical protein [Bacteroidota bacterium]